MKKIIILVNLINLIILAACSSNNPQSINHIQELPLASRLPEAFRSLLPEDYEIPAKLPQTIEDPHILAAWIYLYNQTAPIIVHDGSSLTGRSLAETVLNQNIPVQWGSDEICNGNSCSKRFICEDADCIENFQAEKVYPIYISQRYQDTTNITLARLAGSLAHELYHHQLPFGPVDTSLYEEYWAYYVGAQIEQAKWAIFEGYNPNSSACLKAWFRSHGQTGYFGSDEYPSTLQIEVDRTSEVCITN